MATAAEITLARAKKLLAQASQRLPEVAAMHDQYAQRLQMIKRYRKAYREYCWPVQSIDDYQLAPFHLLAHENSFNMDRDHLWHMARITALCQADPDFFTLTDYRVVNLSAQSERETALHWWQKLTAKGGEGMVVKPLAFTAKSKSALAQPAIKCRGPEYLRIIYGPEYTAADNLRRLRKRGLGKKRALALREYALGYDALKGFVERMALHKTHALVFAVLALETETVDPRL